MPVNPNKQQYNKGLEGKAKVMELIASGAYDNYVPSINVPTYQANYDPNLNAAQPNVSQFQMPPDAQLPSFNEAAVGYAQAQNPLYNSRQGVRGDFSLRNNALQEMDAALQQRQEIIRQQLKAKLASRQPQAQAQQPQSEIAQR